jgi:hypothetical protein
MDVSRGSCGVEVMITGVVTSGGILYQEADHTPATLRARFREAPAPRALLLNHQCVVRVTIIAWKLHSMEREVDLRVREVTHRNVRRECVTISLTRARSIRLRHWIRRCLAAKQSLAHQFPEIHFTVTWVFCQWLQTDHA